MMGGMKKLSYSVMVLFLISGCQASNEQSSVPTDIVASSSPVGIESDMFPTLTVTPTPSNTAPPTFTPQPSFTPTITPIPPTITPTPFPNNNVSPDDIPFNEVIVDYLKNDSVFYVKYSGSIDIMIRNQYGDETGVNSAYNPNHKYYEIPHSNYTPNYVNGEKWLIIKNPEPLSITIYIEYLTFGNYSVEVGLRDPLIPEDQIFHKEDGNISIRETRELKMDIPVTHTYLEHKLTLGIGKNYFGEVGVPVTFIGTIYDRVPEEDVDILWEFGDGEIQKGGFLTSHSYKELGTYSGKLSFDNRKGVVVERFFEVHVFNNNFVLMGLKRIDIGKNVMLVSGDIGTWWDDHTSYMFIDDNFIVLDENSKIISNQVRKKTEEVELSNTGTFYNGERVYQNEDDKSKFVFPLDIRFPEDLAFLDVVRKDVIVNQDQAINLLSGNYGELSISNRGVVTLSGGEYSFINIVIGHEGKMYFDDPSTVIVKETISTSSKVVIAPAPDSGLIASEINFVVSSPYDDKGQSDSGREINIGKFSYIRAHIYLPNFTIRVEENSILVGVFIAKVIVVEGDVIVTYEGN